MHVRPYIFIIKKCRYTYITIIAMLLEKARFIFSDLFVPHRAQSESLSLMALFPAPQRKHRVPGAPVATEETILRRLPLSCIADDCSCLSDFDFTKLRQPIVNSFDPNDKTCLQGNVVMDSTLGRYLDYMIRFENTGTAEAVNITIEDEIETEVFDINTLRIVDASHPVQSFTEGDFVLLGLIRQSLS